MKKNILYSLFGAILLSFTGCNYDFLDVKNLSVFDPKDTWNDPKLANAYLTDLYSSLPGWPVNSGNFADESGSILDESYVQTTNANFKYWPYANIRKINLLLSEIDGGALSENDRKVIKGQAQVLRAYHYFKTLIHHGGVPIIKVPQLLTDELKVPRNTSMECFDFILDDLNTAIAALPNRYTGNDYGRIDKAAALALKGKVLLFKASPQFNPANPYGNAYWQDAYKANKDAKTQLEAWGYGLLAKYEDIFMTEAHKEAVFPVVYMNPGKLDGRKENGVRPLSESKNATSSDQPIWSLVSSYPMKDGRAPGQSPKYTYDVQRYWQNRDPRFDATVAYNAAIFPLGVSATRRQYTDGKVGDPIDGFYDGQSYYRTGFYCRKGIDNTLTIATIGLNAVDWLEIRFAEVLLNFAEAANETGNAAEALTVLKQIRQRAGIEAGADGNYGVTAKTKEEIREAIYLENYLEFAFEGRRFWELRRTRRLHTTIDKMVKYGLQATLKTGLDPKAKVAYLPEDFDYKVRELINQGAKQMYAPEKFYFFPISKGEIERNPNLKQNSGWDGGDFVATF